jgi:hypothetical protein
MLLIITNSADFHTDAVIQKIREKNFGDFFRLNTEYLHRDYHIEIYPVEKKFILKNKLNGKTADSNNIKTVWWRRPEKIKIAENEIAKMLHDYLRDEYHIMLRSLINILSVNKCKIVTDLPELNRAKDKAIQQIWAGECGFKIPKQLITTTNDSFTNYFKNIKETISKSIDSIETIRDNEKDKDYNLFANTINTDLRNDIETGNIKINISYFQEKISRKYELRVIAFGKYVFPFKIDKNNYDIDWRRIDPDSIKFELIQNDNLNTMCNDYLNKSSLKFGAFDLIVDQFDNIYFIECNPNGQFLFCDINGKTNLLSSFVQYLYE